MLTTLLSNALTNEQTDNMTNWHTNCSLFLVDDDLVCNEVTTLLMEQYENAGDSDDDSPMPDPSFFETMSELVMLDFFTIQKRASDFDNHVDFSSKILKRKTI